MSDETGESKSGELLPAERGSTKTATSRVYHVNRKPRSALVDMLYSYADQRRHEAETRRDLAVADNIKAKNEIAKAMKEWLVAEEILHNIENIKKTVSRGIQADLREEELRLQTTERALGFEKMTNLAEEEELKNRFLQAKLRNKKLEAQLNGTEEPIDEKIAEAEAEKRAIIEEFANKQDAAGGELREEEENDYSGRLTVVIERIARLNEKRDRSNSEFGD